MVKMKVKPLSVNECWQGKRVKTKKYREFEKKLLILLPKVELPKPPLAIRFEFGFSNIASDWDNPVKPLQDILQKRYKFNDKHVFLALVKKVIVKKGEEYFSFEIKTMNS